jgi:hypothetical protein
MPSYLPKLARITITALLISISIAAQHTAPPWDFSYKSVLEKNNVGKDELIRTWLGRYKSPAVKWFSEWNGKPIVSSILIEHPNFHAAEYTITWLIRTDDEAFYWEMVEGHETDRNEEPISPQTYDEIYRLASSWEQLTPRPAKDLQKEEWPGYFGFLSYHGPSGSRQILLTMEDFIICPDRSNCVPGKLKSGRVMAALDPILIPDERKNYKHRSEAEIARMTPAERIDEEIREHEFHMWDASDKHSQLIRKYRERDALAGWAHLVELIDSYDPRRIFSDRSGDAVIIASDIDDRVVRLRASVEGRSVIGAIERVSARMIATGKKYSYEELDLPKLRGVNFVDLAIADTLWVKYRIKISEAELLEFSNYLVQFDPTYPSWSEREYTRDNSRKTGTGIAPLVVLMKNPTRYRLAYLAFKSNAAHKQAVQQSGCVMPNVNMQSDPTPIRTTHSPAHQPDSRTPEQIIRIAKTMDADCDGISNYEDNCPGIPNPDQKDRNRNRLGDACEQRQRQSRH